MNLSPISESPHPYGDISHLPEEIRKACEDCHDKLTVDELQSVRDYFQTKIEKLREMEESTCTIEDFDEVKKDANEYQESEEESEEESE